MKYDDIVLILLWWDFEIKMKLIIIINLIRWIVQANGGYDLTVIKFIGLIAYEKFYF